MSPEREAGGRNHGYYLFFIAAALAVMTKGPVGFIVTGVPVFLFLLLQGSFRELSRVFLGRGMLLLLALVPQILSSQWPGAWLTESLGPERLAEANPYLSTLGQWLRYILGGMLVMGDCGGMAGPFGSGYR